jgi:hypothetical protein
MPAVDPKSPVDDSLEEAEEGTKMDVVPAKAEKSNPKKRPAQTDLVCSCHLVS